MQGTRPHALFIVDDSPAIRERLGELLAGLPGVEVVGHAASAAAAVAAIVDLRPDTVLLDLELHGSNGLQVLRAVRPQMPHVAFIVLTNHVEPQYRRACSQAGAAYFLDKGREFDRVAEVVASLAPGRE